MNLLPKNTFYEDFFDDFMPPKDFKGMMKCDIYEKDDMCFIVTDIPGYNKEDISIDYEDGYLTITAKKDEKIDESNDKKYVRRERRFGKISRTFYLGNIKEDNINAKFEDGILTIEVPKEEKNDSKKHIIIQ